VQDSLLQYFGESEITFDHFVIQTPSGQVLKGGKVVKLEPQVFTFLLLLIRHKEHIVSRDEIVAAVWGDKKASDDAIRALVKKLRIALGDNARAPKFLKTVPLQGYLFIMPVQIEFYQPEWWRSKYTIYAASSVVIILITLLIQAQFGTFQSNEDKRKREVVISTITQMKGSEVSPYLSKNNYLLFSHRGINDKSLHLYVKALNSPVLKRLTWDNADYIDGIFSSDGSQAIVKKRDGQIESLLLFNFDINFNVLNAETIELDEALLLQRINAISYSHDDQHLYLFGEVKSDNLFLTSSGDSTSSTVSSENQAISNDSITTELDGSGDQNLSNLIQSANFGLIRYNIESRQSLLLSLPVPLGSRVVDAKESIDGEYLAVLIRSDNHADIHIQELEFNEVKFVKRVPMLSNSIVWAPDNTSITFSTKAGELLNLNIAKQRLYRWSGLPLKVSKVVSQCGEYCFVIKEKEDDVMNIVERPFAFSQKSYISANQFSLTSNDRFPTYFDKGNGIYFLSLSDRALAIKRYIDGKGLETIYELPKTSNIKSFVLSPDEKQFAGELDGRIFIYNIVRRTLSFLSSEASIITDPVWLNDHVLLYQQIESGSAVIYAHDFESSSERVLAKGLLFIKPLSDTRWLLMDEQMNAYLYKRMGDKSEQLEGTPELPFFSPDMLDENTKFAQLDSVNSNGFHVLDNALYFISSSDGVHLLHKIELETGKRENRDLGFQSVLTQFDIHPDMQRMLLVESSLSQSNLLKVDGLTLTTRQINQVVTEIP
jgi:DNA-binding winged helix-turn-helix (wHTH) protein